MLGQCQKITIPKIVYKGVEALYIDVSATTARVLDAAYGYSITPSQAAFLYGFSKESYQRAAQRFLFKLGIDTSTIDSKQVTEFFKDLVKTNLDAFNKVFQHYGTEIQIFKDKDIAEARNEVRQRCN